MTRHSPALHYTAGKAAASDRTGVTVCYRVTMARRRSAEAVALHYARGSLTLADSYYVNNFAILEQRNGDLLSHLVVRRAVHAELPQPAPGRNILLLEVTLHRLCQLNGLYISEAELHCAVTVFFRCPDFNDRAGPCFNNCHRYRLAFFVEDLGHPYLAAQNPHTH
ncbi:hypothetical protein SDC9_155847 [bioreactor metagenome]|uniref:Uncharacterized protein n=1 Tax=bioreactor metagenome TaxID=1076179 RepID=A0A645F7I3_9ZZZZ